MKNTIADLNNYLFEQLEREGKTVSEIVRETGVSFPTVRKYKAEVDAAKTEVHDGEMYSTAKGDAADTD